MNKVTIELHDNPDGTVAVCTTFQPPLSSAVPSKAQIFGMALMEIVNEKTELPEGEKR